MDFLQAFQDIIHNRFVQILLTIIVVLILQILMRSPIERLVRQATRSHRYSSKEEERKREDTLITVFHTAFSVVIWIVAIIIMLVQLRVNLAGLLTSAGLIGVIIGVGAQGAIRDFLAGFFVILENQYRVGDIVTLHTAVAGAISGVVEDITVRITKLRDLDGNLHIVSNGSVGAITNMTFQFANVNVDIPVSYAADIERVKKAIDEVGVELAADEHLGIDIIEPIQFLRVDDFGDSALVVKALGKVKAGTQWDVAGEFRRRIKNAFDKKSIEIPLPQVVVHQQRHKRK